MLGDPEKAIASLSNTIRMTEQRNSEEIFIVQNKCYNKPSLNLCMCIMYNLHLFSGLYKHLISISFRKCKMYIQLGKDPNCPK